ncbi:MAG: hypothetical protein IT580_07905, partial [Verrucomicrobiales bacterium]|nr:hypothetical protein [Verrucomicrobiales bacterium]
MNVRLGSYPYPAHPPSSERSTPPASAPAAVLLGLSCWLIAGWIAHAAAPVGPQLTIESTDSQVRLSWPVTQGAFRLQVSREAAPSALWQDVDPVPVVNGRHEILQPTEAEAMFFRLRQPAGTAPTLGDWSLSRPTVAVDTNGFVRLAYHDPDGDLAAFRLVWTNVLGTFTSELGAEALGAQGPEGTVEIP